MGKPEFRPKSHSKTEQIAFLPTMGGHQFAHAGSTAVEVLIVPGKPNVFVYTFYRFTDTHSLS